LLEQKNEKQKQAMKVKLNLSGFRKKMYGILPFLINDFKIISKTYVAFLKWYKI
jgi:hypothetical protein